MHKEEQKFSEKPIRDHTAIEMASFIVENRFSKIKPLMSVTYQILFHQIKPTLVLLNNGSERILKNFKKGAKAFPKFNTMYADYNTKVTDTGILQFVKFVGIKPADLPVVVYVPFTQGVNRILPKFKTQKITKRGITKMVEDADAGTIQPYKKSSRYGKNLTVNGYTSVSLENLEEVVLDKEKIFVLGLDFISEFSPIILRKHFKSLSKKVTENKIQENVEFGICDLMENEIAEFFEIKMVPSIVMFIKGDVKNPIYYDGKFEIDLISDWVKEQSGVNVRGFKTVDL